MKSKTVIIALLLCMILIAAGCSPANTDGTTDTVSTAESADAVDIDLTALSSTMVYAEVYNMVTKPEGYIGKTVKASGAYQASYYEVTDSYYHYIVVADATACCSQGLEFVLKGEHTYPKDYPADGTEIELIGTFGTYTELDIVYNCLFVDEIKIVEK